MILKFYMEKDVNNWKILRCNKLTKYFNKKSGKLNMININKDIEIDFSEILLQIEKLRKFKLIGKVKMIITLSKVEFWIK